MLIIAWKCFYFQNESNNLSKIASKKIWDVIRYQSICKIKDIDL